MTHVKVTLPSICRPHEYKVFLETNFRDAVLNYYDNLDDLKRDMLHNNWDYRHAMRLGRKAVRRSLTVKELQNLEPRLEFE